MTMLVSKPHARALHAGLCLMALALGALLGLSPATAQVEDLAPESDGQETEGGADDDADEAESAEDDTEGSTATDTGTGAESEALEVAESALYAHPPTDALPPILVDSVPPQAVCVVQPSLCPEELRPVTDVLIDGVDTVQQEAPVAPVQPVAEGTVSVGYFGGSKRYESALRLELPEIPEDEEILSFRVSFPQAQPTYDLSSPMVRDVVQSAFVAVGDSDPAVVAERLPEILQDSEPVEIDTDAIGIEACPLTEPFEPGGAPEAQHRDDLPRVEGEGESDGTAPAAVDCQLGGSGSYDAEEERWVFDLAFAAEAWTSGELENHGILLSPGGVPNLAYGDPDLTTNAQIGLGLDDVTVAMETAEPPPPVEGLDGETASLGDADTDADTAGGDDLGLEQGTPPAASGSDLSGGDTGADAAPSPDVADGPAPSGSESPAPEPQTAAPGELGAAQPAGQETGTPWWVWLLVPVFAGGAYLVGNVMTAAPLSAVAGTSRGGALSRLLERSGDGGLPA